MRLIDAEGSELQTQLKIIREAEYQIYGSGSWGFTAKCEHAIENAPTIQPEPHWIPVTERLPEYGVDCLVTVKQKYTWQTDWEYFVDLGWRGDYIDGAWDTANDWDEGQETHISAWMPMPEPFKGVTS